MGLISWQRHYPDGKLALTNLSRGGRQEVSQDGVKYNVDVVPLYALRGYLSSKKWNS
jgi:hypothetical protein